eukprot:CAMPEP_0175626864 /NCGR_PEP_ID=MMETSP0096-20121207/71205_1 /TAXON_ID=311494 /ORGANISM="Alexandrium monilatum, Strain CCMP3105" /LENGTH=136 /DNA_ID=CAMNT_0016932247 /DNA_START=56 /DNA_END=462 /DNA_ORIENTATION=+
MGQRQFRLREAVPAERAPALLRVRACAEEAARAFFSSSERSDDPLVDVVRRDARAASLFIRTVMLVSGLGSLVVCAVSVVFLVAFWTRCGNCDRPLRWWLLVHTVLQLSQMPVRCVFLLKVRFAEARASRVEASVA